LGMKKTFGRVLAGSKRPTPSESIEALASIMKSDKITISALVVLIILLVAVACKTQPRPSQPVSPSLTQASPTTMFTAPLPTRAPLSDAELENFFGDESCSWPCWQGITPGTTSNADAIQRLNDSSLALKNSVQLEGSATESGKANWRWKIGNKQPILEDDMEWQDGIVWKIGLTAYSMVSIG